MNNSERNSDIDWDSCVICQKKELDKLQCPAESTHRRAGAAIGTGYTSLAQNILEFQNLGVDTPFSKISCTSVEGLSSVLLEKKAKWHKTCHLKYNTTKLERLRKCINESSTANEGDKK